MHSIQQECLFVVCFFCDLKEFVILDLTWKNTHTSSSVWTWWHIKRWMWRKRIAKVFFCLLRPCRFAFILFRFFFIFCFLLILFEDNFGEFNNETLIFRACNKFSCVLNVKRLWWVHECERLYDFYIFHSQQVNLCMVYLWFFFFCTRSSSWLSCFLLPFG